MSDHPFVLVEWYRIAQRPLPFRLNRDPYRVWVSEIMAQQTQIDTLIPFYERWMARLPDLESLAKADEQDLLKLWEGLGYYSRVRNLHKAAQLIQDTYGGVFPRDLEQIRKLPGIGPYTAAAIASICYDTPAAAIDGNVKRVMSRLFRMDESQLKAEFPKRITALVEDWMRVVPPHELTQALMELGALVCTKRPDCSRCPLKEKCEANLNGQVDLYPSVSPKPEKKTEHLEVLCLKDPEGRIALTLSHADRLMQGYYRLPTLAQCANLPSGPKVRAAQLKHIFTHRIWLVDVYTATTDTADADFLWVKPEDIGHYPVITLHRKWLDADAL